ncbi:MAG TPA: hypothetical protein VF550_16785 [Polyangia bacterium]
MIHNRLKDNWHRMRILVALARGHYEKTKGSDFRRRKIEGGDHFPFDAMAYESMESERCIVEMAAVWSVIPVDSLVNLAIAELMDEVDHVATAIERPKKLVTRGIEPMPLTDLAQKTAILGSRTDLKQDATEVRETCEHLAMMRNRIVHDKPFELVDHHDDGVELREYPWKWPGREFEARFENLQGVFQMCDQVKDFVAAAVPNIKDECMEYQFGQLYDG